jgi:Ni/Co efflux regulator RcnB
MKKVLLIAVAAIYSGAVFAAGETATQSKENASSSQAQSKDTAAWVSDEKADNTGDKKLIKKATPKAKQGAKEEADKNQSVSNKQHSAEHSSK